MNRRLISFYFDYDKAKKFFPQGYRLLMQKELEKELLNGLV